MRAEAVAKSDIGLVRRSNQDSFGVDEQYGLYLVCDGMGGAAGGEVASALAVETFLEVARQELNCIACDPMELTPRSLRRAVAAANRAVIARANWDLRLRGMGSTLVGARVVGGRVTILNVGDSRAYLVRAGVAQQVTEDHSFVAEQIRLGLLAESQAELSPMRSVITRAIGADVDVLADEFELAVESGDALLLCSDGLTRHVDPIEIAAHVSSAAILASACDGLIALAKARGGSDNVTCLLVRIA